jgi:hypothetical protein
MINIDDLLSRFLFAEEPFPTEANTSFKRKS